MADIDIYPLIATGLIALAAFLFILFILKGRRHPYYACETLLTPAELKFYQSLEKNIPAHIGVSFKTRLNDIITCEDRDWHKGHGPKIAAKHIDFVLFDKVTTEIVGCIELDDSSHQRKDRKCRDDFVNKALERSGVILHRMKVKSYYSAKEINDLLSKF